MKFELDPVYPSEEVSISGFTDDMEYGGAHEYEFKNCEGYKDGKTVYVDSVQKIQFVQKLHDGSMVPGLQSEQLVIALLDRHEKLNKQYPSKQNQQMVDGLNMFLQACAERVLDRVSRGVMGDLKK